MMPFHSISNNALQQLDVRIVQKKVLTTDYYQGESNTNLLHTGKTLMDEDFAQMSRMRTILPIIQNHEEKEIEIGSKYCLLIRANSKFRTRWDILIICLSLWVCFIMPVQIAFEPQSLTGPVNLYINDCIDIIFCLDVIINFRTTIFSITDDEIFDSKTIAYTYLKSRFVLDLLSSIPFDTIIGNQDGDQLNFRFRIFSILKMIRILRFTKIISYLNATDSVKLSLKLFKLIFYLIVYIHLQACAWFYYTLQDRSWYPLPDIIRHQEHFYDESFIYTYCFSVWHSVSILNGEDMVPATYHQAIVTSVLVIVSEFIHAHILGTIGVVLSALNHKSAKFQEQIEFATSTMKNMKIDAILQHKIIEYITIKHNDLDAQKELETLMNMLSPSLKHLVSQHLFLNALNSISVFTKNTEIVEFVVSSIEPLQFMPEDYIIRQGHKATHMYILANGQCEVLVKDQFRKETFVREISPGMLFGEVALLYDTKRTASVRSKDQCTVGALSEENFKELIRNYPELQRSMMLQARKYRDHWKMYQIAVLSRVDYLQSLPFNLKEEIHYKLTLENYEKGAKIFHKGSECKAIYFVVNGELELYLDFVDQEHVLDDLSPGSILGQYSIINESTFPFTARAKTNLSLLILSRESFLQIVEDNEYLSEAIQGVTKYIIDNEVPLCDYLKVTQPVDDLDKPESIDRFRNAVKKVIILNKSKSQSKVKLLEIIDFIRAQRKQQAQSLLNNLKELQEKGTLKSQQSIELSPAVGEEIHSSKQLSNKLELMNAGQSSQKRKSGYPEIQSPIDQQMLNQQPESSQKASPTNIQFTTVGSGHIVTTNSDLRKIQTEVSSIANDIKNILNIIQMQHKDISLIKQTLDISKENSPRLLKEDSAQQITIFNQQDLPIMPKIDIAHHNDQNTFTEISQNQQNNVNLTSHFAQQSTSKKNSARKKHPNINEPNFSPSKQSSLKNSPPIDAPTKITSIVSQVIHTKNEAYRPSVQDVIKAVLKQQLSTKQQYNPFNQGYLHLNQRPMLNSNFSSKHMSTNNLTSKSVSPSNKKDNIIAQAFSHKLYQSTLTTAAPTSTHQETLDKKEQEVTQILSQRNKVHPIEVNTVSEIQQSTFKNEDPQYPQNTSPTLNILKPQNPIENKDVQSKSVPQVNSNQPRLSQNHHLTQPFENSQKNQSSLDSNNLQAKSTTKQVNPDYLRMIMQLQKSKANMRAASQSNLLVSNDKLSQLAQNPARKSEIPYNQIKGFGKQIDQNPKNQDSSGGDLSVIEQSNQIDKRNKSQSSMDLHQLENRLLDLSGNQSSVDLSKSRDELPNANKYKFGEPIEEEKEEKETIQSQEFGQKKYQQPALRNALNLQKSQKESRKHYQTNPALQAYMKGSMIASSDQQAANNNINNNSLDTQYFVSDNGEEADETRVVRNLALQSVESMQNMIQDTRPVSYPTFSKKNSSPGKGPRESILVAKEDVDEMIEEELSRIQ